MIPRKASLSTNNKQFGEIVVEVEVGVPEDIQEASEFYGGEEKLLEVIQQETIRRKINAARPVLRDSETELDWASVAQQVAEQYQPGRRGGFSATVSESEVESATTVEELKALLAARGILR